MTAGDQNPPRYTCEHGYSGQCSACQNKMFDDAMALHNKKVRKAAIAEGKRLAFTEAAKRFEETIAVWGIMISTTEQPQPVIDVMNAAIEDVKDTLKRMAAEQEA